jgi:hypothetical protein
LRDIQVKDRQGWDRQECLSYNIMAIGWGKSFEEQVEEANQRASDRRAPKVPLEDRVREQRLKSLEVSRSRVEGQLNKAVHPAHREMLMKALQALSKEIDELTFDPEG